MSTARAHTQREDARTLLHRTLWGPQLDHALCELRSRYPEASFEIAGVETAIADAAREIEAWLLAGGEPPERRAPQACDFHAGGGTELPEDDFGDG